MEIHLCVTCCFSLAAFKAFPLCLIFVSLINMCLKVFLLGLNLLSVLFALDYFLSIRKFLTTISSNIFSDSFSFYSGTLIILWGVGVFNIVPEVSETQFFSFFFLYSSLQQLFPSFYLPAHLSIFLPQLLGYWFLLEYFKLKIKLFRLMFI